MLNIHIIINIHIFRKIGVKLFKFQLQDDNRDQCITLEDLLPNEPLQPISYNSLLILLGI